MKDLESSRNSQGELDGLRMVDPTINLLAKKLKYGGFLDTLSTKMGINVKETSPFVDYKK